MYALAMSRNSPVHLAKRISIAELQNRGILFQPGEAVAVAQLVIHSRRAAGNALRELTAPSGAPTTFNVYLEADGSVTCPPGDAAFTVWEVAVFLQALLPHGRPGAPRVSGSLRYTIARALLEVDAPPFESIDEFSQALARHERGERTAIVRVLLERVLGESPATARLPSHFDRRRAAPTVADLRHQLRQADTRLYEQQLALKALSAMTTTRAHPRYRRAAAVAAGLAIALALIGFRKTVPPQRSPSGAVQRPSSIDAGSTSSIAADLASGPSLLESSNLGSNASGPLTLPAAAARVAMRPQRLRQPVPLRPNSVDVRSTPATTANLASGPGLLEATNLGWSGKSPLPLPAPGGRVSHPGDRARGTSSQMREGEKSRGERQSADERPGTGVSRVTSKAGRSLLNRLHQWLPEKIVLRVDSL
jgi:hypothetical protein